MSIAVLNSPELTSAGLQVLSVYDLNMLTNISSVQLAIPVSGSGVQAF
jgi:hypothetical protein